MTNSFTFMASTAVLVLLLITSAKGDVGPSFLSSSFDNICNEVECGKGNCKMDLGSRYGFSCACDNGWKHTSSGNDTGLQFLPCIFPNCSINNSCMPAPPPAPVMSSDLSLTAPPPATPLTSNLSIFSPCDWVDCGEGTCGKNTTYFYTCNCDSGAYNLLNNTEFPCYSNCSLGSDCKMLGIGVSAPPLPMPPPPPGSQATALLSGEFHWRAIIFVLMIILSSIN